MISPRTSVIIVSRGRASHLHRCLTALTLQHHQDYEIILVADPEGLSQRPDLDIKRIAFDIANISEARNLGIAVAAGEVIAFIDDDAMAEPCWLARLTEPFHDPDVIAATGWTRNRDGFSWQARSHRVGPDGAALSLAPERQIRLHPPRDDAPVSTLGTNCAFRANDLREIGGFDPAFPYHLDESDVNFRMASRFPDGLTAIVPAAQVIHEQAGSVHRTDALAIRDLGMQGRSSVLFARRHGGGDPTGTLVPRYRKRLLRQMLDGRLDPLAVDRLLRTLYSGIAEGEAAPLPAPPNARHDTPPPFRCMPRLENDTLVLTGWHWQARDLRRRAAAAVAGGQIVTVILMSPSFLPHRVGFTAGGWFEQCGGVWGASERSDPPVRLWRKEERCRRETDLAEDRRNLSLWAGVCAARL